MPQPATQNTAADPLPSLTVTRLYDAPRERVFRAWTDPAQFSSWMGPGSIRAEVSAMEAKPGGAYRITLHGTPKGMSVVSGIYREVVPPERIVFTWAWEEDEATHRAGHESVVTVTLKAVGAKTELTLRHERLESVASRDSHGQGWNGCLDKLGPYLAGRAA
jgi:uncharacterized protein YndB with AHSA1/START domain